MSSRCATIDVLAPSSPARSADSSDFRDHSRNASLTGRSAMPAEHRQRAEAHQRQDRGDGAIERVPAHHVTQLVGQQDAELVLVQQLERGGMEHDERIVDPVRAGVEERRLGDVQLRDVRPVEGGADLDVQLPERGNWVGPTRTALPWNRRRMPRSPPRKASIFRMTSSTPGMARRACSAARSAGCSQRDRGDLGKRAAGPRGGKSRHDQALVEGWRPYVGRPAVVSE